jgi:hypothetical protein
MCNRFAFKDFGGHALCDLTVIAASSPPELMRRNYDPNDASTDAGPSGPPLLRCEGHQCGSRVCSHVSGKILARMQPAVLHERYSSHMHV